MKLAAISETVGICGNCQKDDHAHCQRLAGSLTGDMAYCTCKCSGLETSLGAPQGSFKKVPVRIKRQFPRMK